MKNSIPQTRQPSALLPGLAALLLLALLAGCNVGPRYQPPAATAPVAYKESPDQFKEIEGWKVAQPSDAALRGKWWEIYNQPELNDLEEQLNVNNQNIRQSFENFMEARSLVREARSQFFPTVTVGPSFSRSRQSANVGSGSNAASGSGTSTVKPANLTILPVDVSWMPDLWDKVRNTVRAGQYQAQLSAADLENERLSEQASLAQFFFEIRGQDEHMGQAMLGVLDLLDANWGQWSYNPQSGHVKFESQTVLEKFNALLHEIRQAGTDQAATQKRLALVMQQTAPTAQ